MVESEEQQVVEEEVSNPQETVEETPISDEEPSPPEEETPDTPPEDQEGEVKEVVDEYSPDLSYKVDREVKQMPEYMKKLIKDKEVEEYQRRLHEQAAGLPDIETRKNRYKGERDEMKQRFEKMEFLLKNHPDEFLDLVGISNEQLFDIAKRKIDARNGQGDVSQTSGPSGSELFDTRATQEQLKTQNTQVMSQLHEMKLQTALNNPDVANFVRDFDTRVGYQGAFREEVEIVGNNEWIRSKGTNYVTPESAVQTVYQKAMKIMYPDGPPQTMGVATSAQTARIPGQRPDTIPNVGAAKGVAPVRKQTESLDEMRKLAEIALAQEQGR